MQPEEVVDLFRKTGALLEGHFIYTSGRHGDRFLQAARVLQYPNHTERLCRALARTLNRDDIALVAGPATGGIILAYETARHLNARAVFSEKAADGSMSIRRGFRIDPGAPAFVVEDIITTGGSVQKTIDHLRERGADVVAVGALIDRSGGTAHFDCPFYALAAIELESWPPGACPLCAKNAPLVEPDTIVV
jgi:orotate phosphoribosyltransferase